jgi:hypothetical protein
VLKQRRGIHQWRLQRACFSCTRPSYSTLAAWPLNHSLPGRPSDLTFSPRPGCSTFPCYLRFCPTVVHSFRQHRTHIHFVSAAPRRVAFAAPPIHSLPPCAPSQDRYLSRLATSSLPVPSTSTIVISFARPPPFLSTLTVQRTVDSCPVHVRLRLLSGPINHRIVIPRHCHVFTVTLFLFTTSRSIRSTSTSRPQDKE